MIESLGVMRNCWRKAVRETQSGLQITLHDGNECPGPKQDPGRYAAVVGYPGRSRLVNDCSVGRVRQVETVRCLYTADGVEAEAAYQDMLEYARQEGRLASTKRDEPARHTPTCVGTVEAAINEAKEDGQGA